MQELYTENNKEVLKKIREKNTEKKSKVKIEMYKKNRK